MAVIDCNFSGASLFNMLNMFIISKWTQFTLLLIINSLKKALPASCGVCVNSNSDCLLTSSVHSPSWLLNAVIMLQSSTWAEQLVIGFNRDNIVFYSTLSKNRCVLRVSSWTISDGQLPSRQSACTCKCICCVPPVSCRTLLMRQTSACDNRTTSFSSTLPFRRQLYRTRQVYHARVLINVQHTHTFPHAHTHLSLWCPAICRWPCL